MGDTFEEVVEVVPAAAATISETDKLTDKEIADLKAMTIRVREQKEALEQVIKDTNGQLSKFIADEVAKQIAASKSPFTTVCFFQFPEKEKRTKSCSIKKLEQQLKERM